jgi:large subunit ribosomal protein L6
LLGFSHPIKYPIPQNLEIKVDKQNNIEIFGADKQLVGQVAAEIRSFRGPEPYKGKGIKYSGEFIVRKEGKKK